MIFFTFINKNYVNSFLLFNGNYYCIYLVLKIVIFSKREYYMIQTVICNMMRF